MEPGLTDIDWIAAGLRALAGLVLFLFGVSLLSRNLKEVSGDRVRAIFARAAGNRFSGLATGTAATVALDSSSATIILVIALVDAGLLTFAQSLPVILGSNIGTTFSSQVFAFGADDYAPLLLFAGFVGRVLARTEKGRSVGDAVLSFGLVLFGLSLIGEAAEPLGDDPRVRQVLARLGNPLLGVLAGAVATVAIQSSSATLGIVIALAGAGVIELPAGLAIMLDTEIGTCADTLVASIGRSRQALRAGVFHLGFNIVSVGVGLLLLAPLTVFARWSSGNTANQIANAHVAFNVLGALVVLGFVGLLAKALERLVPDRAPVAAEPVAKAPS